ncbi:MAG: hypothetical protein DCC65_16860 [Planctomycetota bacterium]|nr:MAG: hypothetical protein DCC65_16860 [Planctomycetota bacterium]
MGNSSESCCSFLTKRLDSKHVDVPPIPGFEEDVIKYHLVLLHDAGYLRCEPVRSSTSDRVIYVRPFDLTWQGHEFLDKIRNPRIWDEVIASIKEQGFASASVELLKMLADAAIRKHFPGG